MQSSQRTSMRGRHSKPRLLRYGGNDEKLSHMKTARETGRQGREKCWHWHLQMWFVKCNAVYPHSRNLYFTTSLERNKLIIAATSNHA
ncbi:uncharacterized protein LACBIDRAFT_317822 [Laccaria bicolor S238N-H82]|uniref:Predicted protein n=1 Tax=Laccaria bicolor (strain S238N-H82 / ATCC MYA-4686) TaxID=486041 RepID=B0D5B5_LACBS|nr:uncharacterized protein LACBIDRAFT_317822 [Laccaria bicolor S238N-H82]EDR09987.1 predicted protein [Laccaria bicolor S238N-H82]|eukprot:XP_001879372.1 predicted protein [Laccaria bicolor S238N-H82]